MSNIVDKKEFTSFSYLSLYGLMNDNKDMNKNHGESKPELDVKDVSLDVKCN